MTQPTPNDPDTMAFWLREFPTTLAEWQASPMVHPYTCPDRSSTEHYDNGRDRGVLTVVDESLLRCDVCGYEQTVDRVWGVGDV